MIDGKRDHYKPLEYPFAFEAYHLQNKLHWMPEEVALFNDVSDWNNKLTKEEKNLLTQIFRFFTQGDVDVSRAYTDLYMPKFGGHPEVRMMLSSFANAEATHVHAYSLLLDTVGMPEAEYKAFSEYEAMAAKHEYAQSFDMKTKANTAKSLAVYSAFTEGMQLFSSFAILLNFSRFGKMKGMSTIVTWSIRDESLHVDSMIKLFRTYVSENPSVWTKGLKTEIQEIAKAMVDLEFKFIDLAFELGGIEGLTPDEVKEYVRYIADRRLIQLGLEPVFKVKVNPLDWLDYLLVAPEHSNFFENRSTEYSKGSLTGSWSSIWGVKQ